MTLLKDSNKIILCILDGWGIGKPGPNNAITLEAKHWESILKRYPNAALEASAEDVGLPPGQMGNSEVGHMTIGLGRKLIQDLPRINQAIQQQNLQTNDNLVNFIAKLKGSNGVCHIMGLLSPGGVHSKEDHLFALLKILQAAGIPVKIHAFLDGRDTPQKSAKLSLEKLASQLAFNQQLVSLTGRYYAMDRDQRWDRTEKAYNGVVLGESIYQFKDALEAVDYFYAQDITDEFIPPCIIGPTKEEVKEGEMAIINAISSTDGLLMFNFRADRVRQLLTACVEPTFNSFSRKSFVPLTALLGMTQYSDQLDNFILPMFPRLPLNNGLGEVISGHGYHQLRLAETEKYAHVTFFFNGGREVPFPQEDRLLIPSPPVNTYDEKPEMSAAAITRSALDAINKQIYKLIVINYANADMVGHSGCLLATRQAISVLDRAINNLEQAAIANNYTLIITADHGNAEQMEDKTAHPHTFHTCNPVPFVVINVGNCKLRPTGTLADIAPTILDLLRLEKPAEMTGKSLIINELTT